MTACTAQTCAPSGARIVLVSPYELGRQPFNLAQPAAWFGRADISVACVDLSQQKLDPGHVRRRRLRRDLSGHAHGHADRRGGVAENPCAGTARAHRRVRPVCAGQRGLAENTRGGSDLRRRIRTRPAGLGADWRCAGRTVVRREKIDFLLPDRSALPELTRYARLILADGTEKTTGFAEASRGCKHLCRHCPVVPVYEGKFRVVPVETVIADIAQQVAWARAHQLRRPRFSQRPDPCAENRRGAARALSRSHLGCDDQGRASTESCRAVAAPQAMRPAVHRHRGRVGRRRDSRQARQGPHAADFEAALAHCRALGIALAPTFVPFTPWTTLAGYRDLLATLLRAAGWSRRCRRCSWRSVCWCRRARI
jgi:hypothetical protein